MSTCVLTRFAGIRRTMVGLWAAFMTAAQAQTGFTVASSGEGHLANAYERMFNNVGILGLPATPADSGSPHQVSWTIWNAPETYPYNTGVYDWTSGAGGILTLINGPQVSVTLSGEVTPLSTFGDTTGPTRWDNYPVGTFTSSAVPSLPNNGDYIFAGGSGNPVQTITFSQPLQNPVLNLWSLGGGGIIGALSFDQPFVLLSEDSTPGIGFRSDGDILYGNESSGTIEFPGAYTSISFTVDNPEWGFGWNIGAASVVTAPEPSVLQLTGVAGLGWLLFHRYRRYLRSLK